MLPIRLLFPGYSYRTIYPTAQTSVLRDVCQSVAGPESRNTCSRSNLRPQSYPFVVLVSTNLQNFSKRMLEQIFRHDSPFQYLRLIGWFKIQFRWYLHKHNCDVFGLSNKMCMNELFWQIVLLSFRLPQRLTALAFVFIGNAFAVTSMNIFQNIPIRCRVTHKNWK